MFSFQLDIILKCWSMEEEDVKIVVIRLQMGGCWIINITMKIWTKWNFANNKYRIIHECRDGFFHFEFLSGIPFEWSDANCFVKFVQLEHNIQILATSFKELCYLFWNTNNSFWDVGKSLGTTPDYRNRQMLTNSQSTTYAQITT